MSPKDDIEYVEKTYLPIDAQFTLLDIVSSRLGYAVIDTANAITCDQIAHLVMKSNKVSYPQLDKEKSQLKKAPYAYVQSSEQPEIETDISVFAIDDVAITGVKTEMNIQTLKDIREQSPFKYNTLHGWVSYDENSVEGYLPDQEGFDQSGKQAGKTSFMPGTAEKLVENAIDLLNEVHY